MSQSQEKTEKPTSKRLADLRKKGDIARSYDFNISATFFGTLFVFLILKESISQNLFETTRYLLSLSNIEVDHSIISTFLKKFLVTFFPFALLTLVISIFFSMIPSGLVITKPKVKFDNINPIKNLKKLFTLDKLFDLIKNTIKVVIISIILWNFFSDELLSYFSSLKMSIQDSVYFMTRNIEKIMLTIATILFIIGVIDLFYQLYRYNKRIKMTKQEVKDEFKEMEGNPYIKGKIRTMMREFTKRNKISQVKEASVVIRNPTHFAVALRYKPPIDKAPKVIAKGRDKLALKIIEIAYKNGIPITSDPPLARAIYKMCDVGQEINPIFYRAVATIIANIYNLKTKNINRTLS